MKIDLYNYLLWPQFDYSDGWGGESTAQDASQTWVKDSYQNLEPSYEMTVPESTSKGRYKKIDKPNTNYSQAYLKNCQY